MEFVIGRDNLACTVFVPWDCRNNCPFCTSKSMYKDLKNADINTICDRIRELNYHPDIKEFVITGGEPLDDIYSLKSIIDSISPDKPVYINTTFPSYESSDYLFKVVDYINSEAKIKGLNISRHMSFDFKGVASPLLLATIKKPIRINTVISNGKFDIDEFERFVHKWGSRNRMINLRSDYRETTLDSLKSRDSVEEALLTKYSFRGIGSCLVCYTESFEAPNCTIQYHRGLEKSSVQFGDKVYVGDVIIFPDGELCYDWDRSTSDDFLKWSSDLGKYELAVEGLKSVGIISCSSEVRSSCGTMSGCGCVPSCGVSSICGSRSRC